MTQDDSLVVLAKQQTSFLDFAKQKHTNRLNDSNHTTRILTNI